MLVCSGFWRCGRSKRLQGLRSHSGPLRGPASAYAATARGLYDRWQPLCVHPARWQRHFRNSVFGAKNPNRLLRLPSRPAGREGLGESGGYKSCAANNLPQNTPSQLGTELVRFAACGLSRKVSESRNSCLRPTQYQRMDIVSPLIRIHHFQIHQMPRHAKLVRDAIPPHHVPRQPRNVQ